MIFQTESECLKVEIVSYESPHERGEDADWLVLRGTYTADGETAVDRNACLSTSELRELSAGLKVLAAGIRDSYESDFLSQDFTLSVLREGEDAFRAYVTFAMLCADVEFDTAELDVRGDGTLLQDWIRDLDAAAGRFPERK